MSAGMESLSRGELPLWDSAVGMGTPHLQNPILATFYPLLWPLAAAPQSILLFNALVVLHLALAGMGMWRLSRALELSAAPSALGAVTLVFSGALLTSTNYVYLLFGWTWVPWALSALVRPHMAPPRRAVAIAIPVAMVLLAGCPDAAVAVGVLSVAVLAAHRYSYTSKDLGWTLVGLAIGGAIGLLQWAPALAYWPESERAGGAAGAREGLWSLHPARFMQLVVPDFFGRLTPVNGYWGQAFTDTLSDGTFFFPELYLGSAVLGLLPLAVTGKNARLGRWVAAATALFLVVSLGRHGVVDLVPRVFRYPERWMFAATVGLAVLSALGLSALPTATRPVRVAAGVVTAMVALAGLWVLLADETLSDLIAQTSMVPNVDAARADQRLGAGIAVGGAALLGVTLVRPRWHALALVATILQLTAAHWHTIWTAPATIDASAAMVADRLGAPPLRIARHPQLDRVQLHAAEAGLWANWERHRATFRGNMGRPYGLDTLHDETPARLAHAIAPETAFWSDPVAFSRVFGVQRILVSATDTPDSVTRALGHGLAPTVGLRRLDLGVASPTDAPFAGAFCIGHFERVSVGEPQSVVRPLERAPVESDAELAPGPGGNALPCATVRASSASAREAEVTTPARTLLVFQTAFARGWTATIDGAEAPVLRAYGSLASVVVPPGNHRIALRYEARGLLLGQISAGFGLLALLALGVLSRRRARAAPS